MTYPVSLDEHVEKEKHPLVKKAKRRKQSTEYPWLSRCGKFFISNPQNSSGTYNHLIGKFEITSLLVSRPPVNPLHYEPKYSG